MDMPASTHGSDEFVTADRYARYLEPTTPRRFAFRAVDAVGLRHWQQAFRAALAEAVGLPRIAQRCPDAPVARKRGETELADHVREDWELIPEPGFRVPFFLLRPTGVTGKRPLVLTPHGHGPRSRFTYAGVLEDDAQRESVLSGERDIALQAVREGYVVIAPEARAFDEGRAQADIDADRHSSCEMWQMRALMFGRTLIGERVWDLMRLIDYAATRPEIDTSRVAVTGNSGGGTTSLFAAALDERISAAVPGSYFCTFLGSIGSIRHCTCNYVPGIMELAEMADVAGLIAPRPLLIVNGEQDPIFPADATRAAFDATRQIYAAAGAPDACQLYFGDGGHRYYKAPVWPFVAKALA